MFRPVAVNDNTGAIYPGMLIRNRNTRNDAGFEIFSVMIGDDSIGQVFIKDIPAIPAPSGPTPEGYSWRELTQAERDAYMSSLTRVQPTFGDSLAEGGIPTVQTPTTEF